MLLLFDIDGTLVAGATAAHRDALAAALRAVHGVDAADKLLAPEERAGRTDGEIARMMLLVAGVDAKKIDDGADAVREACCREYARRCPDDLSSKVLPGVPELLTSLRECGGAQLALLSGNFEPIARLKLARAGIGDFFAAGQGAFGSDAEDRAVLPFLARRRAGEGDGPYPRAKTIVIGDTPLDIACARADGVRCVAVATGPFAPELLHEADAVVGDARRLDGVLRAMLDAG